MAIGDISIHALVKRATARITPTTVYYNNFNPRPRKEGDAQVLNASWDKIFISIHALVKRATALGYASAHGDPISIHALVKRATTWRL